MKRWAGAAGMLTVLCAGCSDKAEPKYAECVKLDASGETLAAWQACQDAVTADPNSKSGKAAAALLKEMKPRYEAKQVEEAARRAAKEKEEAERRAEQQREAARIAKAKERVASMLVYEGATASGSTIVLRSEHCDQFGATVMGNALRQKIGDTDLVAVGLSRFECHHPFGSVFAVTYSNLRPQTVTPSSPESTDEDDALARRAFVEQMNAKFTKETGVPRLRIGAAPGATTLVMLSINDCNEAALRTLVAKNEDGLVDTWRKKGFLRIACDGTTGGHAEWTLGADVVGSTPQPSSGGEDSPPTSPPAPDCYPCSTQEDFDVAWQKKMKCCPVRGCEGDSDCSGERVCCRIPMGTLCTDAKRCGASDRVP